MKIFFATEIHGESHSHINAHTGNIPHDLVFSHEFPANALLAKLPNTSTRGFLSM